jgi:pentose-5-phosphate-3-epimerase/putative flippase GtrA
MNGAGSVQRTRHGKDANVTRRTDAAAQSPLPTLRSRLMHRFHHSGLSYLLYRYRYLACFTVIGLVSILLELALLRFVLPASWSRAATCGTAFLAGMLFSFSLNAFFNFHVPWKHLKRSFAWFATISILSFTLNMASVHVFHGIFGASYENLRLASAAILFWVGYRLHRRYTFDMAKNFGLAIYASEAEDPWKLFETVGRNCDHVHVDLIDETMSAAAAPVCLEHIRTARHLWPGCPVALHIMSRLPRQWMEATWSLVDWYLLHIESEDDLSDLIFQCRVRGKKVGVVWRPGFDPAGLLPYLPHVDFAMVLGIREPGRSGQAMCPEALDVVATLSALRGRYKFEVMFDGGVKTTNVADIPARYIVAASAVIQAEDPIAAAHMLRSAALFHPHMRVGGPKRRQRR